MTHNTSKTGFIWFLRKKQRLEYASGGRVVAGSNPVTPTGENKGVK